MTEREQSDSMLPDFFDLFESSRKKIGSLGKNSHIGGKELMVNYVFPLFATLHDDLNGALLELAENSDVDTETGDKAREAIIALAAFAEKALIIGGLISREDTPEGPKIGKTEVCAANEVASALVDEFTTSLAVVVRDALEALSDPDEDDEDEDDEDEDEDDEDDEDLDQEDGTPGPSAESPEPASIPQAAPAAPDTAVAKVA